MKSPEEYKRHAQTKRQENAHVQKQAELARQQAVGMAQYVAEQKAKQQALAETKQASHATERQFVSDVLEARGHDKGVMDLPEEKLAGLDDKQKVRLRNEHHRALVSYASAVAGGVERKLRAGYGDAMLGGGDVSAREVMGELTASRGRGYQAGIEALAQERGLDSNVAAGAAGEASWRRHSHECGR